VTFTKDEIEYYHQISKEKYEMDMQSKSAYDRQQGKLESDKEWQAVVADKDAVIADKDAVIARLQAELDARR